MNTQCAWDPCTVAACYMQGGLITEGFIIDINSPILLLTIRIND